MVNVLSCVLKYIVYHTHKSVNSIISSILDLRETHILCKLSIETNLFSPIGAIILKPIPEPFEVSMIHFLTYKQFLKLIITHRHVKSPYKQLFYIILACVIHFFQDYPTKLRVYF